MIDISRRNILQGLIAAPFIVAIGKVMPIKAANANPIPEFVINADGSCAGTVQVAMQYVDLATGRTFNKIEAFHTDGHGRKEVDLTPPVPPEGIRVDTIAVSMPGSLEYFRKQGAELERAPVEFIQRNNRMVSCGDTVTLHFDPPRRT